MPLLQHVVRPRNEIRESSKSQLKLSKAAYSYARSIKFNPGVQKMQTINFKLRIPCFQFKTYSSPHSKPRNDSPWLAEGLVSVIPNIRIYEITSADFE